MSITVAQIDDWLLLPAETERIEFKEAKNEFDSRKLNEYCVALANEGGGYLVLGVSDKPPRQVVGTRAFLGRNSLRKIFLRDLAFESTSR